MSANATPLYQRLVYASGVVGMVMLWILAWSWRDEPSSILVSSSTFEDELRSDRGVSLIKDMDSSNMCSLSTFNDGQWVHRPKKIKHADATSFEKAVGYHCPATKFQHRCYKRNKHELDRSKKIVDYVWEPSCAQVAFDPKAMADHLVDHRLLLVGDSITQLQFESLSCLLGEHVHVSRDMDTALTGGDRSIKVDQLVQKTAVGTGSMAAVAYVRSDYLVRLDDFKVLQPFEEEGSMLGKGHNFPWAHLIPKFDYIVINTGPHWRSNLRWGPHQSQDELFEAYQKAMDAVFDHLKASVRPHQRVWIRSTPFGHQECHQYSEPQTSVVKPTEEPYEWNMFERFDAYVKDWILKEKDERFEFFDVSFTNLRGDAHSQPDRDCLHFCIPGPVDDWNKLLYHEIAKLTHTNATIL